MKSLEKLFWHTIANYDIVCKHRFFVASSAISLSSKFCPKSDFPWSSLLCFGQPRKKRGGKLSIGRATVTANSELTRKQPSTVTWTARKKAVEAKKKILQSSTAQRSNHMQDASHQSNRRPGIVPRKKKTKSASPLGRVTAVVKKNTNPDGSPRGYLHLFLPCSQVPACPLRSASNFLYMRVYVTL